jgi:hypothetical protein
LDKETTEKKIKELQAAGNIVHTLEISQ